MGYFSELDLTNRENYTDRSYHGFEEQLLWRYEDLKERYSLLSRVGAPIECFNTLSDVYRAMEIAKEDLEEKCDIIIDDDGNAVEYTGEKDDPNQISLFEVVLLPTWFRTAVAA